MVAHRRSLIAANNHPWWLPDWGAVCGIDLRSMALFRVVIAIILLADLLIRASDLQAMYSAEGIYSAEMAREWLGNDWTRWSLYYLNDSAAVSGWLMVLNGMAATALLFGFQTRIATAACWVFLISLQYRSPFSSNGGDILLRVLLFWSLFLPLGACWSIDARLRKQPIRPQFYVSVGTFALILQLCLMYYFTGNAKMTKYWHDGTALQYVLMFDDYGRPVRHLMLLAPIVLPLFTWGTLGLEMMGPFFLWVPWFTRSIRLALIAVFISFHLGIELTMTVGLFSWVSIAAWLLLLPDVVWEFRWRRGASSGQGGSESVSAPIKTAESIQPVLSAARSIYPASPASWWRWSAINVVCLFFLVYVIASNLGGLGDSKDKDDIWKTTFAPRDSKWIGKVMGLSQNWNMFGSPPRHVGWYEGRAETASGDVIDLLRGGAPFTDSPPDRFSAQFPNHRWRKMMRAIRPKKSERRVIKKVRQSLAEFLVADWNQSHPPDERVTKLVIVRHSRPVSLEGKPTKTTTDHWLDYEPTEPADEP